MTATVAQARELLANLRDDDEFDRTLGGLNQAIMRGNDADGWEQVGWIDIVHGTLDLYGIGSWENGEFEAEVATATG